jgi:2-oxoglutarate ferredoxin oxidoreductase subunit gamma
MNRPSLARFEQRIKQGGLLLVNSSLVRDHPQRGDIRSCRIPASDLAAGSGLDRSANMVMLGAYLELTGIVSPDSVIKALEEVLPRSRRHTLPANRKAMLEWARAVRNLNREFRAG